MTHSRPSDDLIQAICRVFYRPRADIYNSSFSNSLVEFLFEFEFNLLFSFAVNVYVKADADQAKTLNYVLESLDRLI